MGLFDFLFGRRSAEQAEVGARVAEARARVEAAEAAGSADYDRRWAVERERARLERYFFWSSDDQLAWCRDLLERVRRAVGGELIHLPAEDELQLRFVARLVSMRIALDTGGPRARVECKVTNRGAPLRLCHSLEAWIGDEPDDEWAESQSVRRTVAPGVFVEGERDEVDAMQARLAALGGSVSSDVTAFMTAHRVGCVDVTADRASIHGAPDLSEMAAPDRYLLDAVNVLAAIASAVAV